jgi:hypothetical protein
VQALKFEKRAKEIDGLVRAAIMSLEKDKAKLAPVDRDQDRIHCEAFALKIFGNADRVDRLGRSDANTAKAYYAASYFLEVSTCSQEHAGRVPCCCRVLVLGEPTHLFVHCLSLQACKQ